MLFPPFLVCVGVISAVEPVAPEVRVTNVRRVFHNGEHNAFTHMIRFRDRFYLAFRSCPDGHMIYPTSSNIILESEDGQTWKKVHHFRVPKRDLRDPHFLVLHDTLFVNVSAWYCGDKPTPPEEYGFNKHLGYGCRSKDGSTWSDPFMLEGTYGHFVGRTTTHNGTAYMCGRRKHEFTETSRNIRSDCESVMLESDDGFVWRTRAIFQTTLGNETAFLFEPDGSILAVSRYTMEKSQLCQSKPPYSQWERSDLARFIGGPLLVKWGGHYLVGGRNTSGPRWGGAFQVDGQKPTGPRPVTTLYWLVDGKLIECAALPSGGDNSYPGFIELSPTRGLLSWYSTHEKDDSGKPMTAIYLADLEIVE